MAPPVNASSVSGSQNPSRAPNVTFGEVLNFQSAGLKEWTVTGIDPKTGRVTVAKRAGDSIENRSIPLAEYRKAKDEQKKSKKKYLKPAFRLGQTLSLGQNALRVEGYDGASGSALVEGVLDGRPIRQWVKQNDLNKAVSSPDAETLQKSFEAVRKAAPQKPEAAASSRTVPERPSPASSPAAVSIEAAAKEEAESSRPITSPEPVAPRVEAEEAVPSKPEEQKGPRDIREIRRELRERRASKEAEGVAAKIPVEEALREGIQAEKRVTDARISELNKRLSVPPAPEIETPEQRKLAEKERDTLGAYRNLLDADEEIAASKEADPETFRKTAQKREELKAAYQKSLEETKAAAKEAKLPPAQIEAVEANLNMNKPLVDIGGRVAELKSSKSELRQFAGQRGFSSELRNEMKKLDRNLRSIMREGSATVQTHLSGSAEATLATKITGRVTPPQAGVELETRGEVSGRLAQGGRAGAGGAARGAAAAGAAVTAAASAAGALAADQAQTLARAQSALVAINSQIQSRDEGLNQIRGQLQELSRSYQQKDMQRRAAEREGKTNEALVLTGELETLDSGRRSLQENQLNAQADLVDLKSRAQKLRVGINNVEQAEGEAPQALLESLEAAIPPEIGRALPPSRPGVVRAAPESKALPTRAAPESAGLRTAAAKEAPKEAAPQKGFETPSRSYSPTLPSLPAKRAGGAGRAVRQRLTKQLGTPFPNATAVSLNVEQQAARRGADQGMSDAYEQALSQEGGFAQPALPSYTNAGPPESEVEEEDLFESDFAKRRQVREREAEQRAAKENLFPEEAVIQEAPPAARRELIPNEGKSEMTASGPMRDQIPTPAPSVGPLEAARAQKFQAAQAGARGASATELVSAIGGQGASEIFDNIQAIKKISNTYKAVKAGSAVTVIGIIITILVANLQLIGGRIMKLKIVPKQTLVEDVLTVIVDILLLVFCVVTTAMAFAIPAVIVAVIGGAIWYIHGFFSSPSSTETTSVLITHTLVYLKIVLMV